MRNNDDLTGMKFNRLTVVELNKEYAKEYFEKTDKKARFWDCICECGNNHIVKTSDLKSGETKSCGCLLKSIGGSRIEDLKGLRFNSLTVLELDMDRMKLYKSSHNRSRTYWMCRCDCGNYVSVEKDKLKTGHTTSCGCAFSEISKKNAINKANNEESFMDWCKQNNHEDWLRLWDYKLNKLEPKDVCSKSGKKYYFMCPRGIHESKKSQVYSLVYNNSLVCDKCNSFGQYLTDISESGDIFKYWSDKNTINPFKIGKCSDKKVWIKCINNPSHMDYLTNAYVFYGGSRCPYCNHKKVAKEESLGVTNPEIFSIWSEKNKKTPYDYYNSSEKKIWIKCRKNIHPDELRTVGSVIKGNLECGKCSIARKESRHANVLKQMFVKLKEGTEIECRDCINPKTGRPLPTDVVNHKEKIAIEVQSEYHDKPKQKLKDEIKKNYWIDRGYKMYQLDYRDYTIVEMVNIFFNDIDSIPEWVDTTYNSSISHSDVQNLLNENMSVGKIAEKLSCDKVTVYKAIKQHNLKRPDGYSRYNPKKVKRLLDGDEVIYNSVKQASITEGLKEDSIYNALYTKAKLYGCRWEYV